MKLQNERRLATGAIVRRRSLLRFGVAKQTLDEISTERRCREVFGDTFSRDNQKTCGASLRYADVGVRNFVTTLLSAPSGLACVPLFTHGLRRWLYSGAASRLLVGPLLHFCSRARLRHRLVCPAWSVMASCPMLARVVHSLRCYA
jgi:hypothetical protein